MDERPQQSGPAAVESAEERVEHAQQAKAMLQSAIDAITPRMAHRSPESIRDRLTTAIAAAGLPEQPRPWIESTVAEIAAGRLVVVDARFEMDSSGPGVSDPVSQ